MITYCKSFDERIEEIRADIHITRDLIEYHQSRGETSEAADLWQDIAAMQNEIAEIEEERKVFNSRVGYAD